ncbi:putative E3 ubiquitin-protein ligase UHRF1 [Glarea lozoyensis 74030]|uniref:Putative E3 ubiquitin-protein ligase UHRF1 n=1 Tax=Glarea lozoyensis (strain ATCC 74030 / MF5533) TaxID=1104152 RepID=H0EEC4_GLAL7|nr:putative E3 ubiquitin-protein ligase UHRF1 [Glarea lozoyensis 74030]
MAVLQNNEVIMGNTDESNFEVKEEILDEVKPEVTELQAEIARLAAPYLDNLSTFQANAENMRAISFMALKMKRSGSAARVDDSEWSRLVLSLYTWANVEMTPEVKEATHVFGILKAIKKPEHNFPEHYQRIATSLFDDFEAINWGAPAPPPPSPRTTTARSSSNNQTATLGSVRTFKPSPNDPIWGDAGIMHHILKIRKVTTTGTGRTSYRIDPAFTSKSPKVYGHNGIAIGTCWPLQITCLRDGVHGHMQAGIHGGSNGAYSILISTGYDDDKDTGDEIWYSDASANRAANETVNASSAGRENLLASINTRNPVRVIRKDTGKWSGAPRKGLWL